MLATMIHIFESNIKFILLTNELFNIFIKLAIALLLKNTALLL